MGASTKTPETLTAAARAAQLSLTARGDGAPSPTAGKISAADARARLALAVDRPANAAADLKVGDELDGSTMVLPVDAIRTYDRNPRLKENPKYLSIKESVRAQGVTNQLTVTKRPGETFYIPFGGGNTRVLVTQELWHETQDSRFKHLTVVYRKWRGDAANIAAHLAENNNRGDTSFWETARGLWDLKQELEKETGRILSASELNKEARRLGMDFGNSSVQAFLFSVEYLSPVGPWLRARGVNQTLKPCIGALHALCTQLGRSATDVRAAIDRVLEFTGELLQSQEANKAPDVEVKLDVDELVRSLSDAVAKLVNVPPARLPLMLAARAANPRMSADELLRMGTAAVPADASPAALDAFARHASRPALPDTAASHVRPSAPAASEPPVQLPLQPAMLASLAQPVPAASGESPADADPPAIPPDATDPSNAPDTVREILADITRVADLADVVAVCEAMPLGYYVELPEAGIASVDGRPCLDAALRRAGWHVLAALSGQFDRHLARRLPTGSRWRQLALGDPDGFASQLQAALAVEDEASRRVFGAGFMHTFFWHPQLGELFLQLWSWALHWRNAEPARFPDRIQDLLT